MWHLAWVRFALYFGCPFILHCFVPNIIALEFFMSASSRVYSCISNHTSGGWGCIWRWIPRISLYSTASASFLMIPCPCSGGEEQRLHVPTRSAALFPQTIAFDDVLMRGLQSVGQASTTWLSASRAVNHEAWFVLLRCPHSHTHARLINRSSHTTLA